MLHFLEILPAKQSNIICTIRELPVRAFHLPPLPLLFTVHNNRSSEVLGVSEGQVVQSLKIISIKQDLIKTNCSFKNIQYISNILIII